MTDEEICINALEEVLTSSIRLYDNLSDSALRDTNDLCSIIRFKKSLANAEVILGRKSRLEAEHYYKVSLEL